MAKNISNDRSSNRKISKIILKGILVIFGIFLIYIIGVYATSPLFDKLDHDRFITLDTQMQGVFQKLKVASGGVDGWKYGTACSANRSGWMATGDYHCVSSISLEKTVTSIGEVNILQSKYFTIINTDKDLKSKTTSDVGLTNVFVANVAYKDYIEVKSGMECRYLIELMQGDDNSGILIYGSAIKNNIGKFIISLRCEDTARSSWYGYVTATSSLML